MGEHEESVQMPNNNISVTETLEEGEIFCGFKLGRNGGETDKSNGPSRPLRAQKKLSRVQSKAQNLFRGNFGEPILKKRRRSEFDSGPSTQNNPNASGPTGIVNNNADQGVFVYPLDLNKKVTEDPLSHSSSEQAKEGAQMVGLEEPEGSNSMGNDSMEDRVLRETERTINLGKVVGAILD
ncbi:hypothetical protein Hanom_Chr09g00816551 [Helianthus anomalus]